MNTHVARTLTNREKVLIGGLGALMPVAANLLIVEWSTPQLSENLRYPEADALRKKALAGGAPVDTTLWTFPKK